MNERNLAKLIAVKLAAEIANLSYPVGMGVAPNRETVERWAQGLLADVRSHPPQQDAGAASS